MESNSQQYYIDHLKYLNRAVLEIVNKALQVNYQNENISIDVIINSDTDSAFFKIKERESKINLYMNNLFFGENNTSEDIEFEETMMNIRKAQYDGYKPILFKEDAWKTTFRS